MRHLSSSTYVRIFAVMGPPLIVVLHMIFRDSVYGYYSILIATSLYIPILLLYLLRRAFSFDEESQGIGYIRQKRASLERQYEKVDVLRARSKTKRREEVCAANKVSRSLYPGATT